MKRIAVVMFIAASAVPMTMVAQDQRAPFRPVTDAMLEKPDAANWPMWRRTLDSWGFSPLDQVNRSKVNQLRMVWSRAMGAGNVQEATPLVYNGVVFLFRNGGIATTLNALTGEALKQARLTGALEDYYASPIGVDDKVYIASEHGKVVVLRAAGNWEVLAINEFDSDIYATPAISEGRMYIRTQDALYAIGTSN